VVLCCLALTAIGTAASGAGRALIGPYFGAPFHVVQNRYTFGQASSWTPDNKVLSSELDRAGVSQIYRSSLDGRHQDCLTCASVKGPNAFAQSRPQGNWIMFDSYGQQPVHTGNPGFGGYGGDLYVIRPDGSHPYRITTTSDPDDGVPYTASSGVPYDNFHAYWSPNGKEIVWTHTEANSLAAGGQTWSILVGDFVVTNGVPSLANVRVVGRPYGAYETQPWAPDGSGFLFSAAGGYNSPYQATPPGWGHMQLYFMRVHGKGASLTHPLVTQISDDMPAYQEQALFTPDMRTVIMMTNRSHSSPDSWTNLIVAAAQRSKFDAPDTGTSQTLQFLSDFVGPDFNSDLYAVDVKTKAIRQLTDYPHGVIPEFYWNHDYTKIIFDVMGVHPVTTRIGQFEGVSRTVSTTIPAAGLYGSPIDMARVGDQAQTVRDPGPTNNKPVAVTAPLSPAPGLPHATKNTDKPTIPNVTATYLTLWLGDLASLETKSGASFSAPPLLSAVGQFG
jgi:hypothetical protein